MTKRPSIPITAYGRGFSAVTACASACVMLSLRQEMCARAALHAVVSFS